MSIHADGEVPCLIFTHNDGTCYNIDLARYNRIHILKDGMKVSNATDNNKKSIVLPLSNYHRFQVGSAVPIVDSGLEQIETESLTHLRFISETKSLMIESPSESTFIIYIYDMDGEQIATSHMRDGQSLSVSALTMGVYMAVATDGKTNLTLKFILK